jgi:hypothetical protein
MVWTCHHATPTGPRALWAKAFAGVNPSRGEQGERLQKPSFSWQAGGGSHQARRSLWNLKSLSSTWCVQQQTSLGSWVQLPGGSDQPDTTPLCDAHPQASLLLIPSHWYFVQLELAHSFHLNSRTCYFRCCVWLLSPIYFQVESQ